MGGTTYLFQLLHFLQQLNVQGSAKGNPWEHLIVQWISGSFQPVSIPYTFNYREILGRSNQSMSEEKQIVIYESEDGQSHLDVRMEETGG